MSDETPCLGLPYILAGQAQKEVTHNEALNLIDAVLHLAVLDRDLAAPPPAPAPGDRYLVAAGADGAWTGRAGQVAVWTSGWRFLEPAEGWTCWVADEDVLLRHDGGGWMPFASAFGLVLIGQGDAAAARAALGLGGIATLDAPAGGVVGATAAQTLANKTLTAPKIDQIGEAAAGMGVTVDGVTCRGGVLIAGSSQGLLRQVDTSFLYVSGGSVHNQSAHILLRGSSHSTAPSQGDLRANNTVALRWDENYVGSPQIYAATTAAAANVYLNSNGFFRSTSSEKYKDRIEPADPAHSLRIVHEAEPIWYRSLCAADRPDWSWWGLSAEREAARDPRLVSWAEEDGALVPDGVHYTAYVPHLIVVAQRQRAQIEALEARLAALEAARRP